MEKTAVEWLEERFEKFLAYYEGHHKSEMYSIHQLSNDFDQAKEMEKEQELKKWIETWSLGYDSGFDNCKKKYETKQQE